MKLPDHITAVEIATPGGPDVLRVVRRPMPAASPDDVLIEVQAAGVNRPDVMQRLGKYLPPPGASDIPGLEVAGTVTAVGAHVTRWQPGDRVCALVAGGGYATYCVAPAAQCLPIPAALSVEAAAAVPETFFTVWTNLFQRGQLRAGEHVLVHGGSSGIGTTAIQLARAFGATVYATAGSRAKCDTCVRLGAAAAIEYHTEDFVAAVKEQTGGRGVDAILDIIGGDYFPRNLEALALNGRLVQVGLIGGGRAQVNLALVLQKRLTITGSTLRARSVDEKGALACELETHVWPLLEAGTVAPLIYKVFPLSDAADAHRAIEAGEHTGKIVLRTTGF